MKSCSKLQHGLLGTHKAGETSKVSAPRKKRLSGPREEMKNLRLSENVGENAGQISIWNAIQRISLALSGYDTFASSAPKEASGTNPYHFVLLP